MKLLYFDLGMGAAGDMLTAALLELLPDRDSFLEELNLIGLPEVSVTAEPSVKCGITGTHVSVRIHGSEEGEEVPHDHTHTHEHDHDHTHAHGHHHAGLTDVEHIISHLAVSEKVREDALNVYRLIAEAESRAHGKPVPEIHFHEVGTMDAIADVTAVCMLMEKLNPDKVVASPVHVGSGHVRCAHGIMPVPAPATAYLLQGIPTYGGGIDGELCTPTGAALLKHFVDEFGDQPVMRVGAIGYGMGKKDFETANCLRAMLGETEGTAETVYELSCNVDDMTAEKISFAMERLFEAGAREVYTVPVGMKKSRPGTWIRVICTGETKQALIRQMFLHTTTIGIWETAAKRYVLNREIVALDTPWGALRRKDCSGYGVSRSKFEYEDLARIARERNMTIDEAAQMLRNAGFRGKDRPMETTRIERIERMERHLDEASASLREMTAALNRYAAARDGIRALAGYYDSGAWREDYEADEAGKLPQDLKRGVLSQDALYDLLADDRALLGHMAELLEIWKKGGVTWS